MARVRGRQKVTQAVPTYFLELADMQAESLGVDRYDVIRQAIAQGLVVLRLNEELRSNVQEYIEGLRELEDHGKGRLKVTYAVPVQLLELADEQAGQLDLDRYDVIRMAIGQGLMVLLLQEQLQNNPQRYVELLQALMDDQPGMYNRLGEKLADDVVMSVQSQKQKKKA